MRRRSYLALLAGTLGTGCLSNASGESPSERDPSTTPDRTDADDGSPESDDDPFESVTVGDPANVTDRKNNRPHSVSVTNDGPARTIAVEINRGPPTRDPLRPALDASYEFPAGGRLTVELVESAPYEVHLSVPDSGQAHSFAIDRSWFDCNYSAHRVTVPATGAVEVTNVSTTMACATATEETFMRTTGQTDASGTELATEESLEPTTTAE